MSDKNTIPFDDKAFITKIRKKISPDRLSIMKRLVKKPWFQATDESVQLELALLPQKGRKNHDGFLEDLASRKSIIGNIEVLRMSDLPKGDLTISPVFDIRDIHTGREFSYEYAAFRHGTPAGVKGLVLIRDGKSAEPTHHVILTCEKFAIAENSYDLIGGLPEVDVDGKNNARNNIIREIREETGVRNLKIDEIKMLGSHSVDPGLTNHKTQLYVAYITTKEAQKISTNAKNLDDTEMNTFVHVLPLAELAELVRETSNAMVLAALAKAVGAGLIPQKYYT